MAGHWISIDRTETPDASVPLRTDGHWAVDGLVGWWDARPRGGSRVYDAVTAIPSAITGTPDWGMAGSRPRLALSGSGNWIPLRTEHAKRPLPLTLVSCVRQHTRTSWPTAIGNDSWKRSGNITNGVDLEIGTSGELACAIGDGTNGGRRSKISAASAVSLNTIHVLVVVVRGSTDMSLFVDGVDVGGSYSGSGGSLHYSSADGSIGGNASPAVYLDGDWFFGGIWGRELSASEIASLSANPNQIYEPHRMFVPGAAAVAGGNIPIFYHHYAMLRAY